MSDRPPLTLIDGGDQPLRVGRVELAQAARPPFPLGAWVREEDRFLVLSAPPEFRPPPELHPIRFHTELVELEPRPLGAIVLRSGSPLEMLAVVVDLDLQPISSPAVVETALAEVMRLVEQRAIRTLGLPLLGAVHRGLEAAVSLSLIREALLMAPEILERVWLETEEGLDTALLAKLLLG